MKKNLWKILIALIIIFLVVVIKPIRTKSVMNCIAVDVFEDIPIYDSLRKQLEGPVISDKGKYLDFKWYKVLKWGDTSILHIEVYKWPSSLSWRDDFYWPRTTMNYQWNYFLFPNGTSKFTNLLYNKDNKNVIDKLAFKPYSKNLEIADSINFIIKPEQLFFFLQKGYFQIIDNQDNYVLIDFYEPIAKIAHKYKNDSITTISAKIYVNDSLELVILPID
jgi:hypothetical protein